MNLVKEHKQHVEHQQKRRAELLELKKQAVAKLNPRLKASAIERLAIHLLDLDQIGNAEISEESYAPNALQSKIIEQREKEAEESLQRQDHEDRLETLCQRILNQNPAIRAKVATKNTNVTDANSIDYRDPQNHLRTKLHQAVYDNDLSTVTLLIEQGANTDLKDADELTPFQAAIGEELLQIAEYLKDK